jgi:Uma2 family endonuclease
MTTYSRVEIAERMTAAEFFRDAPEDRKAELIDGVMIVPSPTFDTHERLQNFLFALLRTDVEENDLGEVRGSRTAVALAEDQAPEPDILFVAKERLAIIQEKGVMGAPDSVIEILSASTMRNDLNGVRRSHRGPKFRAYERAGVRELWLIDPYGPEGTRFFQRQGDQLVEVQPDPRSILRSIAIPGFWIDVRWLWPKDRFIPVRRALASILAE